MKTVSLEALIAHRPISEQHSGRVDDLAEVVMQGARRTAAWAGIGHGLLLLVVVLAQLWMWWVSATTPRMMWLDIGVAMIVTGACWYACQAVIGHRLKRTMFRLSVLDSESLKEIAALVERHPELEPVLNTWAGREGGPLRGYELNLLRRYRPQPSAQVSGARY